MVTKNSKTQNEICKIILKQQYVNEFLNLLRTRENQWDCEFLPNKQAKQFTNLIRFMSEMELFSQKENGKKKNRKQTKTYIKKIKKKQKMKIGNNSKSRHVD